MNTIDSETTSAGLPEVEWRWTFAKSYHRRHSRKSRRSYVRRRVISRCSGPRNKAPTSPSLGSAICLIPTE